MSEEYEKGYQQGVEDLKQRVQRYYRYLSGKTMTAVVEYAIELMAKELIDAKNGELSAKD